MSGTAPVECSRIILKAAQLMRDRHEEIARSITLELGKPIRQSRLEVIRGCEFFEWDAAEGQRLYGRVIPSAPNIRYIVVRQPIGSVAAFSPWNFPMSQPARKIAGALASGCSVILKPAEQTPAGAIHIAWAFADAGLPPGVLNLVFGPPADISGYLIPRDEIRLVAFTGSTTVGRHLTMLAAAHMTPVLMELGGHAPVIVCEDVDSHDVAVVSAVRKMRNLKRCAGYWRRVPMIDFPCPSQPGRMRFEHARPCGPPPTIAERGIFLLHRTPDDRHRAASRRCRDRHVGDNRCVHNGI